MRGLRGWAVAGLALGLAVAGLAGEKPVAEKPFDPGRDPAKDLRAAEARAASEHKNILMDVGGNWCPWCLLLDRTLAEDPVLHAALEKNYVLLRVNWSRENQNAEFLVEYPETRGYPAWYVLSASGRLLKAEDTSELEQTHLLSTGYSKAAVGAFLEKYAPGR